MNEDGVWLALGQTHSSKSLRFHDQNIQKKGRIKRMMKTQVVLPMAALEARDFNKFSDPGFLFFRQKVPNVCGILRTESNLEIRCLSSNRRRV